jgi:hypothetical protein
MAAGGMGSLDVGTAGRDRIHHYSMVDEISLFADPNHRMFNQILMRPILLSCWARYIFVMFFYVFLNQLFTMFTLPSV